MRKRRNWLKSTLAIIVMISTVLNTGFTSIAAELASDSNVAVEASEQVTEDTSVTETTTVVDSSSSTSEEVSGETDSDSMDETVDSVQTSTDSSDDAEVSDTSTAADDEDADTTETSDDASTGRKVEKDATDEDNSAADEEQSAGAVTVSDDEDDSQADIISIDNVDSVDESDDVLELDSVDESNEDTDDVIDTDSEENAEDVDDTEEFVDADENAEDTDVEPAEELSEGVIDVESDRIEGSGYDSIKIYIDTEKLANRDNFRINFTGPDSASYNPVINEELDNTNGGYYEFEQLEGEWFSISAQSSDDVILTYTYNYEGFPAIILESANYEKIINIKNVTLSNGQTCEAISGEGYDFVTININGDEIDENASYTLYVDSNANATVDGMSAYDGISGLTKYTDKIVIDNLEGEQFLAYLVSEVKRPVETHVTSYDEEDGSVDVSISLGAAEKNIEANGDGIIAEGYDEFTISAEYVLRYAASEDEKGEFAYDLYVDTDKEEVTVNGQLLENGKVTLDCNVDEIVIDGLDYETFKVYAVEAVDDDRYAKTGDDETVIDYSIISIDEGTASIGFEYSEASVKDVYEYEDGNIKVTATLQVVDAVPDNAEFVVTEITPNGSSYNYDAYMDALNMNTEKIMGRENDTEYDEFTQDNTLIYDIAFYVNDEDGNRVEYQPTEGTVSIKVDFKAEQLKETIGASEDGDLTIVHLPLVDDVRDSVDTTADATNISKYDIEVEVPQQTTSVDGETVEFTVSDLSAVVFHNSQVVAWNPGTQETFMTAIGNGFRYGIVANQATLVGHLESNMAVGSVHGNPSAIQACKNEGGNAGVSYIGSYDGDGFSYTMNGNDISSPLLIYTSEAAAKKITGGTGVVIDSKKYTETQIKSFVAGLVNEAKDNSVKIIDRSVRTENGAEGAYYADIKHVVPTGNQMTLIDVAGLGTDANGTYYLNMRQGDLASFMSSTNPTIRIKEGQTLIISTPDANVNIGQINMELVSGSGTRTIKSQGYEEEIDKRIVYNMPFAKDVHVSLANGTFICPQATFYVDTVSGGWVIANNIARIGGAEWHCTWKDMPGSEVLPVGVSLVGQKNVNGQPITENKYNKQFRFTLEKYNTVTRAWTKVTTVENDGAAIIFPEETYTEPGTYLYRISEDNIPATSPYVNSLKKDSTKYIVKVVVGSTLSQRVTDGITINTTALKIDSVEYFKGENVGSNGSTSGLGQAYDKAYFNNEIIECEIEVFKELFINGQQIQPGNNEWANKYFYFKVKAIEGADEKGNGGTSGEPLTNINPNTAIGETDKIFAVSVNKSRLIGHLPVYQWYQIEEVAGPNYRTAGGVSVEPLTNVASEKVEWAYETSYRAICYEFLYNDGGSNIRVLPRYPERGSGKLGIINKRDYKCDITIDGTKNIKAKDASVETAVDQSKAGYQFLLKGTNKGTVDCSSVSKSATSDADGNFNFGKLEYNKAGTYVYEVTEINGSVPGMEYDATVHTVTVTVANNNGVLTATKKVDNDPNKVVSFTNKYDAKTSIILNAVKRMQGRKFLSDGKDRYTFTLMGPGIETQTKTIVGTAGEYTKDIVFDEIKYTYKDCGNHVYYMTEEAGSIDGVTYSTATYEVTVNVADNKNGTLTAKVTDIRVDSEGNGQYSTYTQTTPEFVNTYSASGNVGFKVVKRFSGNVPKDTKFTFELYKKDGETLTRLQTKDIVGSGEASFKDPINYTLDDAGETYTYVIKEIPAEGAMIDSVEGSATYGLYVKDGVVYSDEVHTINVTVSDNGSGVLTTAKTVDGSAVEDVVVSFNNSYDTTPTSTDIRGNKNLVNKELTEGMFTFVLEADSSTLAAINNGDVVVPGWANNKATTVNAADTSFAFENITFKKAGTYVFNVSEDTTGTDANLVKDGIKYSNDSFAVTVVVEDNRSGALVVTNKTISGSSDIIFTNVYDAEGSVTIGAIKTLEGQDLENNQFEFVLLDAPDEKANVIRSAKNIGKNVTFDPITYTLEELEARGNNVYTYYVHEVNTGVKGYVYDDSFKKVTVTVVNNGAGALVATPVYENDDNEFINYYYADGEAEIEGSKKFDGDKFRDEYDGQFYAVLKDEDNNVLDRQPITKDTFGNTGSFKFAGIDALKYNKVGTYKYTVSEEGSVEGFDVKNDTRIFDVTVNVWADPKEPGKLKTAVIYGAGSIVFTNTLTAKGSQKLLATKTINAGKGILRDKFQFELLDANGKVIESKVENDLTGLISFSDLSYTLEDLGDETEATFTYFIRETDKTYTGYVNDTKIYGATITVANVGKEELEVGDPVYYNAKYENGQYALDGEIDGVVFDNTYKAFGEVTLEGTKVLIGRDLDEEMFTFELYDDNDKLVGTAKNEAAKEGKAAKFVFDTISYTEDDLTDNNCLDAENHIYAKHYRIIEKKENKPGYVYDKEHTGYNIVVTLEDKGDGKIATDWFAYADGSIAEKESLWDQIKEAFGGTNKTKNVYFENKYLGYGAVVLGAKKNYVGKPLAADMFAFTLKGDGGVNETVANDADGNAIFTRIDYSEKDVDKTYKYTIKEEKSAVITNADGSQTVIKQIPGVEYDTNEYTVEVEITDPNHDGKLVVTTTIDSVVTNSEIVTEAVDGVERFVALCTPDKVVFDNTYIPGELEVVINGDKTVVGRTGKVEEGEFTFVMESTPDNSKEYTDTQSNDADGKFSFAKITYDYEDLKNADGTYAPSREFKYVVREVEGSDEKIIYTDKVVNVVVTIIDNVETGKLEKVVSVDGISDGVASFVNTYKSEGSLPLYVKKFVEGTSSSDKVFKFILTGDGIDKPLEAEAVNGKIGAFEPIKYTLDDLAGQSEATFNYTITEVDLSADKNYSGYTFSDEVYEVVVTVKNVGTEVFDISYVVTGGNEAIEDTDKCDNVIFHNSYDCEGKASLVASKIMINKDLADGDYTFELVKSLDDANAVTINGTKMVATNVAATMNSGKATAKVNFPEITFTRDDLKEVSADGKTATYVKTKSYSYIVREAKVEKSGVTSYNEIYGVTFELTDNEDGTINVDTKTQDLTGKEVGFIEKLLKEVFSGDDDVVFTNEYTAEGSLELEGIKVLDGRALAANEFSFKLEEIKDGKSVAEVIVKNDKDGKISFKDIDFLKYTLDDVGEHEYVVSEVIIDDFAAKGITCKTEPLKLIVDVIDNNDGTISVNEKAGSDIKLGKGIEFTFNNVFDAYGSIDIAGTKVVLGRDMTDEDVYEFTIVDDANPSEVKTVKNVGNKIAFNAKEVPFLNYTLDDLGLHYYTIKETPYNKDGITSDSHWYKVTVDVTLQDINGVVITGIAPNPERVSSVLAANVVEVHEYESERVMSSVAFTTGDYFIFNNTYNAKGSTDISGVKKLVNSDGTAVDSTKNPELIKGKYVFKLLRYDDARRIGSGTLIKSVTCDSRGVFDISIDEFTRADMKVGGKDVTEKTFYYRLVENKPSVGSVKVIDGVQVFESNGVIYDNTQYDIDVTVVDNGKGKLECSKSISKVDGATKEVEPVSTISFTNTVKVVKIEGKKYWHDSVTDPSSREDVVIDLYSSDVDNGKTAVNTFVIKAPSTEYSFTTNRAGEKLPAYDKNGKEIIYSVNEEEVRGYFSERDGFDFHNTSGKILITKIDSKTDETLPGATLAIYDLNKKELEKWVTDKSAHVVESDLVPGQKYVLKELEAPEGYELAEDVEFTVPTDGKDIVVTMEDTPIYGNIRLIKKDVDTRENLAGAEFALYTLDGIRVFATGSIGSYRYSTNTSNGVFVTDSVGSLEIFNLPFGSYYFVETKAPAGYELSTERLSFSITSNGETKELSFYDKKSTGSVRLIKTNATESRRLAGAVFELYSASPQSLGQAAISTLFRNAYYKYGTYVTDKNGEIYVEGLPWDDYYFIEVKAPDGYTIRTDVNGDPLVYTFTIDSASTAVGTVELGMIRNDEDTPPPPGPTPTPTPGPSETPTPTPGPSETPTPTPSVAPTRVPPTPTTGAVLGVRNVKGGVLSGVLGVRARPSHGVLGERKGPVTGDYTNIAIWLVLMLTSMAMIVVMLVKSSKKKTTNK